MPELAKIAGETSLLLDTKEALALRLNRQDSEQANAIFDEIVTSFGDSKKFVNPNDFPVVVYNGFVLPQGGIFSDREMKVALETGHIICDPAPTANAGARINASSIDVTLGNYFYTAGEDGKDGLYNPFDLDDTMRYFNADKSDPDKSALSALPWGEARHHLGKKAVSNLLEKFDYLPGIPDKHPIILLRPNERILAHTNEFIGIIPPGTTSMQARSSFGRIGVSVCYDAGWGDPGFADRWTKEVKNHNENEYVPLPVGMRDAQIVFMSTGPVGTEYSKASGNYQKASFETAYQELEEEFGRQPDFSQFEASHISQSGLHMVSARLRRNLKRNWKPSHTFPQLHKNILHPLVAVEGLTDGWI
jgi:dCTP deaminase